MLGSFETEPMYMDVQFVMQHDPEWHDAVNISVGGLGGEIPWAVASFVFHHRG